ncbi:MAG TPA: hypothetical protein VI007_13520 [bacterium]
MGIVGPTYAFDNLLFAAVNEPIGVANRVRMLTSGAEYRMFVTRPYNCPSEDPATAQVIYFDPTEAGHPEHPFALLNKPDGEAGCQVERYVDVSPGFGGFAPYRDHVFVTWGHKILRIPPDGCGSGSGCVANFTTISECTESHTGITFDPWGAFGYNMIVTCNNGKVFKVTSGGAATQLVDLHQPIESPGVAHPNFGACGGCVFVASETTGNIFAVRPDGTVFGGGPVANLPMAEAIHPIPVNVCNFGTSGGAFFTAIFSGVESTGVYQFPKTSFTMSGQPLNGNILVTSESAETGISVLKPSGGGYALTPWHTPVGQNEGGDFCPRITLPPGQVQLKPDPPFNPKKVEVFKLLFYSSPTFRPLDIDTRTLRAGRIGNEDSLIICFPWPLNRDRVIDLVCLFDTEKAFGIDDDHPTPPVPPVTRVFWSAFTVGSSPQEDPPLDGFGD